MTWRIIEGDCRDALRALPAQSAHTCVTSPPYFGLRDYGHDGQIGLEPTPDEFVATLVGVFREVRRVLRDDGTAWLNLGDSYAANISGGLAGSTLTKGGQQTPHNRVRSPTASRGNAKHKDLLGIPWMVAFALRADGWYLRSDIVWSKPNPMPESVTDRPTKAHEYVFLLSKSAKYYYDADAVREPAQDWGERDRQGALYDGTAYPDRVNGHTGLGRQDYAVAGRNKRSVWTVATQPYAGAHFATFPPKLIEPCILAGAPERACGECGAPWVRVTQREDQGWDGSRYGERAVDATGGAKTGGTERSTLGSSNGKLVGQSRTLGFEPSCSHDDGSASGLVLDPFAGAGTTGMVALRHNRSFVGVELNPEYAAFARWRIIDDAPLLNSPAELVA